MRLALMRRARPMILTEPHPHIQVGSHDTLGTFPALWWAHSIHSATNNRARRISSTDNLLYFGGPIQYFRQRAIGPDRWYRPPLSRPLEGPLGILGTNTQGPTDDIDCDPPILWWAHSILSVTNDRARPMVSTETLILWWAHSILSTTNNKARLMISTNPFPPSGGPTRHSRHQYPGPDR